MSLIALIPCRSGSTRIKDKNIRDLGGKPLIAWSIECALNAGIFDRVIASTDDPGYAEIAKQYGAEVPFLRPEEFAATYSPDIEWLRHLLGEIDCRAFAILRPTSPFRKAESVKAAWETFSGDGKADSMRAIRPVSEHPGKMWRVDGDRMHPLMPLGPLDVPWYTSATQILPEVYVQTAGMEIAWKETVTKYDTTCGRTIMPWILNDPLESLDLNYEEEWEVAAKIAERLAASRS